MKHNAYLDCTPRAEAQEIWIERLRLAGFFSKLPTETISSADALDRVTADTTYAKVSVPHYNGAAMDGIAVYAQDTFGANESEPILLKLLKEGEPFERGGCYVIDTGDMMPRGTNAVIMIEDVQKRDGYMEIIAATAPWKHVRIIGEDIAVKELVLPANRVISPTDIAALLSSGNDKVEVFKRPRVAIIPTGDEIVAADVPLEDGMIRDVNSYMLAAAVNRWKGDAERFPIHKDKKATIKSTVDEALKSFDIVLVLAGTSAGRDDYTSTVLGELGEIVIHGIATKPGKPAVLAICDGKPVIGIPGYPVSAMLVADLFLKSIVCLRQNLKPLEPVSVDAHLVKPCHSAMGAEEYVRVSVGNIQGKLIASPMGRGAGILSSLTKAQGVMRIDSKVTGIDGGEKVRVELLREEDPTDTLISVGSNDIALELMGVFLRRKKMHMTLTCSNVGSMGGILAIKNNEAHIAGVHMLDEETGVYNLPMIKKMLKNGTYRVVHLGRRRQGFIVAKGNPKEIHTLKDLTRSDITFINRQRGSGTRMLLDFELKKNGIDSSLINGYEMEVATDMAIAASVIAGSVDVGLGAQAAADALGLSFIPVAPEDYDLILNFEKGDERFDDVLSVLSSAEFRKEVEALGGYDMSDSGKIII